MKVRNGYDILTWKTENAANTNKSNNDFTTSIRTFRARREDRHRGACDPTIAINHTSD